MNPHPNAINHLRGVARWGFVAKGVIYMTVGVLSALVAVGVRRAPVDTRGAVRQLFKETHSYAFLWTLCAALAVYAAWRLYQSLWGRLPEQHEVPWWRRLHLLFSACIHGGFAFWIARFLASGVSGPSSENQVHATSALVFHQSYGSAVAFIAGAVIAVVGLYQLFRSATGRVANDVDCSGLSRRGSQLLLVLGRMGEATRGVVLLTVSAALVRAASLTNPNEVRGFAGALQSLHHQPGGRWLLLAACAGLMCLGLFLIGSAKIQKL